ncbi:MAG: MerR family transcriptional regulator [Solirubrobacteraceae bacterium]|nr:MerR family transcriptional regulator [Patulibacter sp.]
MPADRLSLPKVEPEWVAATNPFKRRAESVEEPGPFRIGELSRRSGIAVGTIKYYLREGLLPAGTPTSKTQALYDVGHLRRLRLIRALAEVGGLSIAKIKGITSALDADGDHDRGAIQQLAGYALSGPPVGDGLTSHDEDGDEADGEPRTDGLAAARALSDEFVDALGFQVDQHAPARAELADALHALQLLGFADHPIVFYEHARLAYELGSFEIETAGVTEGGTDEAVAVEAIMVGSVVFGAAFMALRRMAHEHESRRRFGE